MKTICLIQNAIKETVLSPEQKKALLERLSSLLTEYYWRSLRFSISFHGLRITITVGSLIVPALLSIQSTANIYWVVWVLSLLVTISNGIMSLLKVDKKYYVLNTTYQHLLSEAWQFVYLSGKYSGYYTPTQKASHENQYIYFCNKIEKIRMKHVEDEYYKVSEQQHPQNDILIPPTPFHMPFSPFSEADEKSDPPINGTPKVRRSSIYKSPFAERREVNTPKSP